MNVFGQDIKHYEYIVLRDSLIYMQGEVFYKSSEPNTVSFKRFNDPVKEFDASEISEFATIGGWTYFSELIGNEYQFLKQLTTDENTLLVLDSRKGSNQTFYLKDSTLIKLQKETYDDQIGSLLLEKRYGSEIAKKTKYNKRSLARAITYSNSDNNFYPKSRFGVLAGLTENIVELKKDEMLGFKPVFNLHVGIFLDMPMQVYSQFSTRIEVQFSENSYSLFIDEGTKYDYLAQIKSISLPILLRYRFKASSRTRLFSNAGLTFSQNFVSNNEVITVSENPKVIDISVLNVPDQMVGGAIGIGAEYSLTYGKDFGVELRYQYLTNTDKLKMNINSFQITTTFNF